MAGGSSAQAKRRSSEGDSTNAAPDIITINGTSLQLNVPEPTQEEMPLEIAKKRTMGMTLPQKLKNIIDPIVQERTIIVDTIRTQSNSNSTIADTVAAAIPFSTPKTVNGPAMASTALTMHSAIKGFVTSQSRPSRAVMKAHDKLEEVLKTAASNFQSDHQVSSSRCFPVLTHQQQQRKFKQNGYAPTDPAHAACVSCGHNFVDEPNANKGLHAKQLQEMRLFEEKKAAAKDEASKNNTTAKRIAAPKLVQAHRQCHCRQLFCVGIGSNVGSSCPIKCRKTDGKACGTNASGACACPICQCQCNLAFTCDAAQALKTRLLLDSHDHQRQQEINVQKSRSALASSLHDATSGALGAALHSGKELPTATIHTMAGAASAQAIAANFDPSLHRGLIRSLRDEIGKPNTKVQLPVATSMNGEVITELDTRNVAGGQKASHREANNHLTAGANAAKTSATFSLNPHKDACDIGSANTGNGTLNDEDAMKCATEASPRTTNRDDDDMARAIQMSLNDSQATVIDSDGKTPPPQKGSKQVVYVLSPPNRSTVVKTASTKTECTKRVQKRAFKRSLETTEVAQLDNPTASPELVATSPYASRAFNELADPIGRPAVSSYLNHCVEANPLADSQEGYYAAANFMRDLDGKPKRKRKNKKVRK